MSSSQNEYKEQRLRDQIEWYGHKARQNKLTFRRCQNSILILSVVILVTNAFFTMFDWGSSMLSISWIISAVLGVSIAVIATITLLEKHYQNWVFYRRIMALLEKEKYFFENSVGEYDRLDEIQRNRILVQRVESIVSGKNPMYFTVRFSNEEALNQSS